jgi:hypothetical protein
VPCLAYQKRKCPAFRRPGGSHILGSYILLVPMLAPTPHNIKQRIVDQKRKEVKGLGYVWPGMQSSQSLTRLDLLL